MSLAVLMSACNSESGAEMLMTTATESSTAPQVANDWSAFAGCYTVSHDEPAQIKISELGDQWVMQMKEPASSGRVWDDPEPLEGLDIGEVERYFSIDPDYVEAMIARPDRVLVLAHIESAYATIDPLLDSEYLAYIYRGANTIYRVDCDTINSDLLADPHANIRIDPISHQ